MKNEDIAVSKQDGGRDLSQELCKSFIYQTALWDSVGKAQSGISAQVQKNSSQMSLENTRSVYMLLWESIAWSVCGAAKQYLTATQTFLLKDQLSGRDTPMAINVPMEFEDENGNIVFDVERMLDKNGKQVENEETSSDGKVVHQPVYQAIVEPATSIVYGDISISVRAMSEYEIEMRNENSALQILQGPTAQILAQYAPEELLVLAAKSLPSNTAFNQFAYETLNRTYYKVIIEKRRQEEMQMQMMMQGQGGGQNAPMFPANGGGSMNGGGASVTGGRQIPLSGSMRRSPGTLAKSDSAQGNPGMRSRVNQKAQGQKSLNTAVARSDSAIT